MDRFLRHSVLITIVVYCMLYGRRRQCNQRQQSIFSVKLAITRWMEIP